MYGYIYMTTNLINNKKYIGKHKSSKFDENYKGSGVALWRAIEKYGIHNFHTEVIDKCYSEKDINDKEKYWINKFNTVESREFYNMKDGGKGGFPPHAGTKHPLYGRRGKDSPNYGKKHSKPHGRIISISKALRGRSWYNDGTNNYFIYSNEATENLSKGMLPKPPRSKELRYNQSKKISGRICVNKNGIDIMISPSMLNKYLDNGYKKGSCKHKVSGMKDKHQTDNYKEFISRNTKGRIWINNGTINKRVYKDNINEYLSNGYVKGRLSRKSNGHRTDS